MNCYYRAMLRRGHGPDPGQWTWAFRTTRSSTPGCPGVVGGEPGPHRTPITQFIIDEELKRA
jgi:hypothetical protein